VGNRTILTVIFDDSTTLGMVRLYVSEAVSKLNEVFNNSQEQSLAGPDAISKEYSESAKGLLDNMFQK